MHDRISYYLKQATTVRANACRAENPDIKGLWLNLAQYYERLSRKRPRIAKFRTRVYIANERAG
jgi:hypothetical protein